MSIERNFQSVELVVKRAHGFTAAETIKTVKEIVRVHNKKWGSKDYILIEPKAYVISKELVAMPKVEAATLREMFSRDKSRLTMSGGLFLERLLKIPGVNRKKLESLGAKACKRADISPINLLVLGYKNGKFVFMPLVDQH